MRELGGALRVGILGDLGLDFARVFSCSVSVACFLVFYVCSLFCGPFSVLSLLLP